MDHHYTGSKILILGGLGFIGYNLATRLLSLGAEVKILDNMYQFGGSSTFHAKNLKDKCEIIFADILDKKTLANVIPGSEVVFNLAAQTSHSLSMENPDFDFTVNAKAQINIAEIMRKEPDILHIYTSTRQVYGNPLYLPVDEKHPVNAPDLNAVSKLSAESIYEFYNKFYGLNTKILRLTNIYGPAMRIRDAKQMFLGEWIRRSLTGDPIILYGNGLLKRDLLYVSDLVDLLCSSSFLASSEYQIFNVGDSHSFELLEVANAIKKIIPSIEINYQETPSIIKSISPSNFCTNTEKLNDYCGWSPKISLGSGLKTTFQYYFKNMEHYLS
tara:strand:+ start:245 stop:1231 length:987 start_codon:yes stop_codon:yes gene_type:complete